MSHAKTTHSNPTRRSVLKGTTAAVAVAGLAFGLPGTASAKAMSGLPIGDRSGADSLCVAHHKELSQHLKSVLNSAYVDESMKNKMLSTSHCPHCKVGLAPDMLDSAAFSVLA